MHNLKEIRKDLDTFKKKINERNINFNFDDLVELDKINREYIQKKERLEQEKKTLSKSAMKQNTKNSRYKILGTYDSEGNKYVDSLTWEEIDAIPSIGEEDC